MDTIISLEVPYFAFIIVTVAAILYILDTTGIYSYVENKIKDRILRKKVQTVVEDLMERAVVHVVPKEHWGADQPTDDEITDFINQAEELGYTFTIEKYREALDKKVFDEDDHFIVIK